jgi:hypothetical protein
MLFDTLRDLRNKEAPLDLARARVIADVAGKVIDTARVEVDYIRATDEIGSDFIAPNSAPKLPVGMKVSTVHRLKG